ncbi:MAG: LysE family translocator [Rhodospirillaceae bacterium]|jgi:homoserine/homoserine lactone efflux protein|nr:LysE family translocator [Rhodospirillaceae bacterium]MBT6117579.1 LysE family translocator [Rhodospirillaceae bacterium]
MNLELYLAFVLATAVLIAIPGPNVTLIVANAMAYGTRRALVTVAGTQAAQAAQLVVVAFGLASLMEVMAEWFEWLRWFGVAYLLWLGIQRWRARPVGAGVADPPGARPRVLFWQGFLVSLTNPKVLFFYAAFFPQFVDPTLPAGPQLVLLCASFLIVAALLDGGYALLAGRARGWIADRRRQRLGNRITGAILLATGAWLALARR